MIGISFDKKEFEYDAYTLIKAFYPKEEIQMYDLSLGEQPTEENLVSITYGKEVVIRLSFHGKNLEGSKAYEEAEERKSRKNKLKQVLYALLVEETGHTLPWGNLTGIRPVKLAMGLLENGMSNAEAAQYMRDTYSTSREKTALAIAIANRERDILKHMDYKNGYSLYVGIPFCPSICLYCSFSSSPIERWKDQVDTYLTALLKELDVTAEMMKGKSLDTIYIGGGTPTTLTPEQLTRLLGHIQQRFPVDKVQEYTIEAGRPDSITREKLCAMRAFPVTRISVNPQTMNQETLDFIGRKHTVEDTRNAFALARACGFDNINMDLIAGLPGEHKAEMQHTLEEIKALDPDSLTVHSLAVKRAARLRMFKEEHQELELENNQEIMDMAMQYAYACQMSPYYLYRQKNISGNLENVGYAKTGKAGIYNILIMEEKQTIVACGAGSISKRVYLDGRIERCENVKEVAQYIKRIDEMIERKRKLFMEL